MFEMKLLPEARAFAQVAVELCSGGSNRNPDGSTIRRFQWVYVLLETRVSESLTKRISRAVTSRKEKAQVATISAHNDTSIGELVADAIEKVGQEGVVREQG